MPFPFLAAAGMGASAAGQGAGGFKQKMAAMQQNLGQSLNQQEATQQPQMNPLDVLYGFIQKKYGTNIRSV